MAFKFIAFAGLLAIAQAGIIPSAPLVYAAHGAPLAYAAHGAPLAYAAHTAPVAYAAHAAPLTYAAPVAKTVVSEDYDPHPQYNYAYDIQDGLTGDNKNHHEVRDGDVVQGSYSLNDPDGFRRTVDYTADPVHGFNAVVRREQLHQKAIVAAPVANYAAPLTYAAPVAKFASPYGYAAPVAQYYHH